MFADKIKITQDYVDLIVKKRKEHNLTAYEFSEMLGKNRSWIPNIENHRTKNLSKENLLLIFRSFAAEEGLDTETYIIKYLHPNAIVMLSDGTQELCFRLQTKLHLTPLPTDPHINIALTPEQKRRDSVYYFRCQLERLLEVTVDRYELLNDQERKYVSDSIGQIKQNIDIDIVTTFSLYNINLFGDDYPLSANAPFAKLINSDVASIIEDTTQSFELCRAKMDVYEYFTATATSSFYVNWDFDDSIDLKEKVEKLQEFLEMVNDYIFDVYNYVTLAFKYSKASSVDFHKIYSMAKQYLYAFVNKAEIFQDLSVVQLPNNNAATESTINALQLTLTDIVHQLQKKFKAKYDIYLENSDSFD